LATLDVDITGFMFFVIEQATIEGNRLLPGVKEARGDHANVGT
jgi:hypothetical protein